MRTIIIGVPCNDACPHPEAMEHTNEIMAEIANLEEGARVLDLGCGYGAAARFLARERGCSVVGINVSKKRIGGGICKSSGGWTTGPFNV